MEKRNIHFNTCVRIIVDVLQIYLINRVFDISGNEVIAIENCYLNSDASVF